jgi:hypothetical protein
VPGNRVLSISANGLAKVGQGSVVLTNLQPDLGSLSIRLGVSRIRKEPIGQLQEPAFQTGALLMCLLQ